MNHIPLYSFLISLESDGFRLTVRDYERIRIALGSGGEWDVARVRSVLAALLVKDEEQRENFLRRFDRFFAPSLKGRPEDLRIDVQKVLEDIQNFTRQSKTALLHERETEPKGPVVSKPPVVERRRPGKPVIAALLLLLICAGIALTFLLRSPPKQQIKPQPTPQTIETTLPLAPDEPLQKPQQRIYHIPVVEDVRPSLITGKDEWKKYAWLSGLLLILAILDGIYLFWYSKRPVKDKGPEWDKNRERHFPLETIGGKPAPRLDEATIAHLADCMGYFRSEAESKELNVAASIQASTDKGGVPEVVFYKRKQIRNLIVLVDTFAEALAWNPIAKELAQGLSRLGVPLLYGMFRGSPEQFFLEDGRTYYLEDLESDRKGYLLLIFSDARGLHKHHSRYTLEAVARWPLAAWMELRTREFWDESSALPAYYGIPLYPATAGGLLRAFGRSMTEISPQKDDATDAQHWQGIPAQGSRRLCEYLEDLLGDALPLAQAGAMMQPISLGMIDALRTEFHKELPPERIERLIALPGTIHSVGGLRFSKPALAILRAGFVIRRSEQEQVQALEFLLREIDRVEPQETQSPAHLAWERMRARVRLELEPDKALKRLSELSQTPLKNAIKEDFENMALPGAAETSDLEESSAIPLRKAPKTAAGKMRLEGMADQISFPIERKHWAILGLCIFLFFISSGVSLFHYLESLKFNAVITFADVKNVNAELRLEVREGEKWNLEASASYSASLKWSLATGREYRLALFGNGTSDPPKELGQVTQNLEISLNTKNVEYPCREPLNETGLSLYRCPDFEGDGRAVQIDAWRETLGQSAPEDRLLSIGLEFRSAAQNEQQLSQTGSLLLKTQSIDLLYSVSSAITEEGLQEALTHIENVVAPWNLQQVQILTWTADQNIDMQNVLAALSDAGRVLALKSPEGIGQFQELVKRSMNLVVTEKELLAAMPEADVKGQGAPLALLSFIVMQFVRIPGGCFQMGQTEAEKAELIKERGEKIYKESYTDELPRHEVCVQEFWMGKYEVTQAQWQRIMDENPASFNRERLGKNTNNHPVEGVSWDAIQEFLKKLNSQSRSTFRLPSEAEWEYACRAGTQTAYSFGDDAEKLGEYAWYDEDVFKGSTHSVGEKKPNAFGLYDMHGNVWEWLADPWHENYDGAQSDGSVWEKDGEVYKRLFRVGSWLAYPGLVRHTC